MSEDQSQLPRTQNPGDQKTRWTAWLALILGWAFGLVFLWSGALKVQDPGQFLISIRSFHILPDPYAAWLALGLPWLEIFAGLAVVTSWLKRGGLLLLNVCLVAFAVALISAWARGLNVDCGCFGGGKSSASSISDALLRDAVLLAVGCWLMFRREDAERSME